MRNFIIFLFTLVSSLSFSDDRKILSYEVERDERTNHITIKIDEEMFKYRIIWGDTLSELAVELDTTVKKLARDNKIKDIDLIYAGDDLDVEKKHSNYKEKTEKEEK